MKHLLYPFIGALAISTLIAGVVAVAFLLCYYWYVPVALFIFTLAYDIGEGICK